MLDGFMEIMDDKNKWEILEKIAYKYKDVIMESNFYWIDTLKILTFVDKERNIHIFVKEYKN